MRVIITLILLCCVLFGALSGAAKAASPDVASSTSGLPLPRFATLKSDNVYMRTGPSMDYPIRWIYKREGMPVEIIQEFDAWRRIKDPEGETGWVHKILLSGRRTAIIRIKGGESSRQQDRVLAYASDELVQPVARLRAGFVVSVEACDKRACFATFPPYEGWIEKKYLWGVYASEIFN